MRMKKWMVIGLLTAVALPGVAADGVVLSVMAQKQTLAITEKGRGALAGVNDEEDLSTDTGLGLGLAIGSPGGDARILIELSGVTVEDAFDVDLYTLGAEQFFPLGERGALRPFVGLNLGYGKLDVESSYAAGTRSSDDSGLVYGVSGGVQYALSPTLALEARLRYLHTGLEADLETAAPGTGVVLGVDNARAVSAGISVQF